MRKKLTAKVKRAKKRPDGIRVWSRSFGGGTMTKEGPEQSEVVWDNTRLANSNGIASCVPNSYIDKRYDDKPSEPLRHRRST